MTTRYRVHITADVVDTLATWITVEADDRANIAETALEQLSRTDDAEWSVVACGNPTNRTVVDIEEDTDDD